VANGLLKARDWLAQHPEVIEEIEQALFANAPVVVEEKDEENDSSI
jgi:hypothetical protein